MEVNTIDAVRTCYLGEGWTWFLLSLIQFYPVILSFKVISIGRRNDVLSTMINFTGTTANFFLAILFSSFVGRKTRMFEECDEKFAAPYPPVVAVFSLLSMYLFGSFALRFHISKVWVFCTILLVVPYCAMLVVNEFQTTGHLFFSIGFGLLMSTLWMTQMMVVFLIAPYIVHSPFGSWLGLGNSMLEDEVAVARLRVEQRRYVDREKQKFVAALGEILRDPAKVREFLD